MGSVIDIQMMQRALRLAKEGLYTCDPNPRVGCVLVKEGDIVGEGWHQRAGEPHAEVNALRRAGVRARGATLYVTLEPCCHHGKTPPCTRAIREAGISRVVAAMEDPNPRVAGRGFAELREAGIEVEVGVLREQAERLNPGFISRMARGRPWVRCKLAMSLDGRTAMASGESRWITGSAAREDVQRLRARSSAILTGIGTVTSDDPSLNVRLPDAERQPVRVVLDRRLQISPNARLFSLPGKVLLFTGEQTPLERFEPLAATGAEIVPVPEAPGGLDLKVVMEQLAQREVNEVMVEAGPTLSGAMLEAGLIDELVIYMAPHLMGSRAKGLFTLTGLEKMHQRIGLLIQEMRPIGEDWRIVASVAQNPR